MLTSMIVSGIRRRIPMMRARGSRPRPVTSPRTRTALSTGSTPETSGSRNWAGYLDNDQTRVSMSHNKNHRRKGSGDHSFPKQAGVIHDAPADRPADDRGTQRRWELMCSEARYQYQRWRCPVLLKVSDSRFQRTGAVALIRRRANSAG